MFTALNSQIPAWPIVSVFRGFSCIGKDNIYGNNVMDPFFKIH